MVSPKIKSDKVPHAKRAKRAKQPVTPVRLHGAIASLKAMVDQLEAEA